MENKKMIKGIILSGIANSGKTTTIDYFLKNHISIHSDYELLIPKCKTSPNFTNSIAIFEYIPQKKIIVVMPYGDTETMIQSYYKECLDHGYNIDIIIGCSRTSGKTVDIHKKNCNEIFWLGKERSRFDKESIEVQHICEATALSIKELLSRIIENNSP